MGMLLPNVANQQVVVSATNYETSNIIHGGETNYIMATVTLYVSIFNLFVSLLKLMGFVSGED